MNKEEILDAPNQEPTPKDRLLYAVLASLLITIPLLVKTFLKLSDWTIPIQYISVITALYFFIKKTNPQTDVISFSVWGVVIVFLGHIFAALGHYIFISENIAYTYSEVFFFTLGNLIKSIFIGYPLYLGVFLWIKKRNWAMLVLMTIVSLMFMTMLYLDHTFETI